MSSPSSNLIINQTFTEQEWMKQINIAIQLGSETISENLSSIFKIPNSISIVKPHFYSPQLVGLGPLHHFKRRLYQNEPLKLSGAELALKRFSVPDFSTLVHQILPLLPNIRLYYDSHLHISDQTLAWVLAIDGLFVAEMLYNPQFLLPRSSNYFSFSERLRAVTGDIVLLENQIPLYSLFPPMISLNLCRMLESFCRVLSPFKLLNDSDYNELNPVLPKHLLDHVYQLISEENRTTTLENHETESSSPSAEESSVGKFGTLADKVGDAKNVTAGIQRLAQIQIKNPISSIFRIIDILGISDWVNQSLDEEKALLPSAADLKRAGLKFSATTGGLRSINFIKSEAVLTLPCFSWKPSSEIVIRNLVAYETLAKPDSAILTRYTEMMHALVRTKVDAKLLREDGIVDGMRNGDEAVAALFSGLGESPADPIMRKAVLDKTIWEVNSYYNRKSKVVVSKVIKLVVKVSLRLLMVVAAIALIVMFSVQTYCSINVCGESGGTATARAVGGISEIGMESLESSVRHVSSY